MSRRRKFAFAVAALLLAFLLFPLVVPGMWDGRRDLRVRFIVVDTTTGAPVPGAVLHVENGPRTYCGDTGDAAFELAADESGIAERLARRCATYGRIWIVGDIRITQTWNSFTPDWTISATAPGYVSGQPIRLLNRRREVRRGDAFSEIDVTVRLSPTGASGPKAPAGDL